MAIDTKSHTDIITEFRALQSKDAVSPESLGYILQRIVDLLATAGTSVVCSCASLGEETVTKILLFHESIDSIEAYNQVDTVA